VECLRGYVIVDVAKCVAHAKEDLQFLDVAIPQRREFVTCATQLLEDAMALTSLEGPEFVTRVDVEVARVKELGKVHISDKKYCERMANELLRFKALTIIGEARAKNWSASCP
jgi:hypothetical protein